MAARIHRLLLGTLTASLAACGGGTAAVGSGDGGTDASTTTSDAGLDAGGELSAPFTCAATQTRYSPAALEALRAATGLDYLEARLVNDGGFDDAGASKKVSIDATAGTKCATASNAAACTAALDALVVTDYLFPQCGGCVPGGDIFAYTRGDTVADVSNQAELSALVATVDAPAKAWVLATAAGFAVSCTKDGWVRETSDGYVLVASHTISDCPFRTERVVLHVARSGEVTVLDRVADAESGACIGRRPNGLVAPCRKRTPAPEIGAHFAEIARLEAASVDAFEILGAELAAHGAPKRLLRRAASAARDETRHARAMARVARRYGGKVEAPRVVRGPVRSLFAIALENAVEGCVRETYGALEGMWQARAAQDPAIRRSMARIARDEARHSALSWDIAAWAERGLSPSDRQRVEDARRAEGEALARRVRKAPSSLLVNVAGVPNEARAAFFADRLREALWRA